MKKLRADTRVTRLNELEVEKRTFLHEVQYTVRARPGPNPDYNSRAPYIYYSSTFVPVYVLYGAFSL